MPSHLHALTSTPGTTLQHRVNYNTSAALLAVVG